MKIDKFDLSRLRNAEHFQFHREYLQLVGKYNFKIKSLLEKYNKIYNDLDEALNRIEKSMLTSLIIEAKLARSKVWRGLVDASLSALNHFEPGILSAALKLEVLFDTYGNISRRSFNAQTAAFYNILQELRGDYAQAVAKVGVEKWVSELESRNIAFGKLVKERYDESAAKPTTVVKKARVEIDRYYRASIDCINAFSQLENGADYEDFIRKMNAIVSKYALAIKTRAGISKKNNEIFVNFT